MFHYRLDVPPSLPINIGDATPVPKGPGTRAWSTISNDEIMWDGTKWIAKQTYISVPSMPLTVSAVAGSSQATISFTAPFTSGSAAITGYTVTSLPAGGVDTNAGTTGLSHIVTGLTNGTAYTFTVTATNSVGTSAPSAASPSVTPIYVAPGIAIFMGGYGSLGATFTGSSNLNYVAIYTFATNVMTTGTNLLTAVFYATGVSDGVHAVCCGGGDPYNNAVNTTANYTYATNTVVAGSNLTIASMMGAGAGNNTTGIIDIGDSYGVVGTGITNLITYASGTFVTGSTLVTGPRDGCATGTATDAMFIGGTNASGTLLNSIVDYNYASNTNALMTVNTFYSNDVKSAGGNSTMAVIGGNYSVNTGNTTVTELVNYAAKTVVFGSNLIYSGRWMAGTSSSTTAIFAGGIGYGNSAPVNTVSLYSYASNVVTAAAILGACEWWVASAAPNSGVNY